MYVVAISSWQNETSELVQALAGVLGITPFEARQRMIGNGPAVVASFADPEMAPALAKELNRVGFSTLIVDADNSGGSAGHFVVRRFKFRPGAMLVESRSGQLQEIPHEEIDLLLAATSIVESSEIKTYTRSKLSLGKTLLSGGIPMAKKVEHREEITTEARGKILYLYGGKRPPVVFSQNGMIYDGFGAAMKLSRELNFAHLIGELRRFRPEAVYDDRLLNRVGQARLLGSTLDPEGNLALAAEILARSLRGGEPETI